MTPSDSPKERLYQLQQETFSNRLTAFMREWGDGDRRFEVEVITIIQMAQALAQLPLIDRLADLAAKAPFTLPFPKPDVKP